MYKNVFKRVIDLSASLIGFIILLPIFLLVTLILLITNGQPFFFQSRPGKNEKVFRIMKFKSMSDKKDKNGKLLPDAERVTTLGIFIRKFSLDEIPQLLNVIKGDMSLIGPRPLLVKYLPYYTEEEKIRHTVRPGITGLAQISGRNSIGWDDKLAKDIEYVKNLSFKTDLIILFKTVEKVVKGSDINLSPDELDFDEYRTVKKTKFIS
ncbi:sugar transferase [Formosa sediminum]|uniref:Sugar transferase n=1 Tax=Formosa sediminum TaxID=2594004 RepID=A0A516GSF3_9FLAO|nr:sugar transferase [Formosa sediminum]QDO94300.1 sugar transferase [Formosa sediminum]